MRFFLIRISVPSMTSSAMPHLTEVPADTVLKWISQAWISATYSEIYSEIFLVAVAGEEATETVIACKDGDKIQIVGEIADLIYHLSVEMGVKDISWSDVFEELKKR